MSLESRETNRGWLKPTCSVVFVTTFLPLVATAVISGKTSVEKMLTIMAQPLFLAILASMVIGVILFRRGERGIGMILAGGACLLWMLGSQAFVNIPLRGWESSFPSSPGGLNEPYDYIVVLGGGTTSAPDGRAQFGSAGDRVGYAARLFLAGKTKNLVTTGDNLTLTGSLSGGYQQHDDPSRQTQRIWMDLGIPKEVISELAGQNTSSEIASLKKHPEYWKDKRCALLTSATHMPRALRLAASAGVTVEPIAVDYRSSNGPWTLDKCIPEAEELMKLQFIIKEWIGMRVGR